MCGCLHAGTRHPSVTALVGFLLVGGFLSDASFSSLKFWACSSVFTRRNICPSNGFGATQVFRCSFSLALMLMMNVPAWIVAARAAGSTSHRTHSIGAGKPHVCQEILGCLGCVLPWVLGTKPFPAWCLPCSSVLAPVSLSCDKVAQQPAGSPFLSPAGAVE